VVVVFSWGCISSLPGVAFRLSLLFSMPAGVVGLLPVVALGLLVPFVFMFVSFYF